MSNLTTTPYLIYRWTNESTQPGDTKGKLELFCRGGRDSDVVLNLPDFAKARELLNYIEGVVARAEKNTKIEAAHEICTHLTGREQF